MGFGGLEVVNIFSLVSTDPAGLYQCADPVGPENDKAIIEAVRLGGLVVCAWGKHGLFKDRAQAVLELLRSAGIRPFCLGKNIDGSPKHPLYLRGSVTPVPM